jgi:hypothetical protein
MTKNSPGLEGHNPKQSGSLYRLRIGGVLPESWEDRLGCLRIVHEEGTEPLTKTTLMGAVKDQSDLLGILNTLHGLRLPLLYLECLDAEVEKNI